MDLGELAGDPLAKFAAAVLAIAGGLRYWRSQSSADAKDRADSSGQIAALDTWKQLLEGERAARVRAEERADRFTQERNEAMQEVFEMKGQLKAMNDLLAAQTVELHALHDQLRRLEAQLESR